MSNKISSKTYSILIVDDHPIICDGINSFINREKDLHVCATAENANTALNALNRFKPDLVTIDIVLEGKSGLDLIKDIFILYPQTHMLVVSFFDEELYAERSLKAGAHGYIMKSEAPENLITAIQSVLKGEIYLSEIMQKRIINTYLHQYKQIGPNKLSTLTDRELDIFRLIGFGRSSSEIAEELCLAPKTVESYRTIIKKKLETTTSNELYFMANKYFSVLKI